MDDKKLLALARKNAAKAAEAAKPKPARTYDKTLPKDRDADDAALERERLFKEMKRREF